MTNSKTTKRALFSSVVALLLCFTMLLGTTFAWFTDSATSATNKIVAGNLDVELYHADKAQHTDDLVGSTNRWKAKADTDLEWAKNNPISIFVEKKVDNTISITFLPVME